MDVALAFLPWQFIWSLQMSNKEKVGVVTAMSMGLLWVSRTTNWWMKLTLDSAAGAATMKTLAFPEVIDNPGKLLLEALRQYLS